MVMLLIAVIWQFSRIAQQLPMVIDGLYLLPLWLSHALSCTLEAMDVLHPTDIYSRPTSRIAFQYICEPLPHWAKR